MAIGTYQDVVTKAYYGPPIGDRYSQLYQITQGLAHIHRLNCVHRDLKPLSIRITHPGGNGEPVLKLADFGLSRFRDGRDDYSFPLWKSADCNLLFVAPEVYHSKEFIWSMDIFSLGCIWAIIMSVNFSHPFGSNLQGIERIKKKQPMKLSLQDFKHLKREDAELVFALVKSMLSFIPGVRPTALDILKNPYFARLLAKDVIVHPTSQHNDAGNQKLFKHSYVQI